MKTMKREEKAKQIARGLAASDDYPYDYLSAYAGANQMAIWMDKQKAEQMMWKAVYWLIDNAQNFGVEQCDVYPMAEELEKYLRFGTKNNDVPSGFEIADSKDEEKMYADRIKNACRL